MVTITRGSNWKIAVYGGEHGLPHFHIEGREFRCSIAIVSLDLIVGFAPASVMREALEWALANRALLMATWVELNG